MAFLRNERRAGGRSTRRSQKRSAPLRSELMELRVRFARHSQWCGGGGGRASFWGTDGVGLAGTWLRKAGAVRLWHQWSDRHLRVEGWHEARSGVWRRVPGGQVSVRGL